MDTRKIKVGNLYIGGGSPITVQSMTNIKTEDYLATKSQISQLVEEGCDIVRCTVPTIEASNNLVKLSREFSIPLVADIHFDHKLAIACADGGVSKIRINPSNIGAEYKVAEVCKALKANGTPVRIGVNGGSLDKDIKEKYGVTAKALVESALRQADVLEKYGVSDIVISVKSSNTLVSYEAYTLLSQVCNYPLHLGVTEAGFGQDALIKSSACMGGLLLNGIGDTIRYSITGSPIDEVKAGISLLTSLKLRESGVEIISCPTCGRTNIDVEGIARNLKDHLSKERKKVKIAVMGCIVNGLGEGEEADFGIAGGKDKSVLFAKRKQIKTVDNEDIIPEMIKLFEEYDG